MSTFGSLVASIKKAEEDGGTKLELQLDADKITSLCKKLEEIFNHKYPKLAFLTKCTFESFFQKQKFYQAFDNKIF